MPKKKLNSPQKGKNDSSFRRRPSSRAAFSRAAFSRAAFSSFSQCTLSDCISHEVDPSRIHHLNDKPIDHDGRYVLYWVQASPRPTFNDALNYACQRANHHQVPVLAVFGLKGSKKLECSERHYRFILEGLQEFDNSLSQHMNIKLLVIHESPEGVATHFAQFAKEIVTDKGYLREQRQYYLNVASRVKCRVTQIESNVIVPVELLTNQEESAAYKIREKIEKYLTRFLVCHEAICPNIPSLLKEDQSEELARLGIAENDSMKENWIEVKDVARALASFNFDFNVPKVTSLVGGHIQAKSRLDDFILKKLRSYHQLRNDPGKNYQSWMSAYLHYGHISPVEILLKVHKAAAPAAAKDSYFNELAVWRELGINYAHFNQKNYDALAGLPNWAIQTAEEHKEDTRHHLYTLEELELGKTDDRYWNACQLEMVFAGKMHGYMRMYWAKRVIEWTPNIQTAYQYLLFLNDKYEMDGRDPNGYAGIAWCFGKHDRPFFERPIFGKLRYMSENAPFKKYGVSADEYVRQCYALAGREEELDMGIQKYFKKEPSKVE